MPGPSTGQRSGAGGELQAQGLSCEQGSRSYRSSQGFQLPEGWAGAAWEAAPQLAAGEFMWLSQFTFIERNRSTELFELEGTPKGHLVQLSQNFEGYC